VPPVQQAAAPHVTWNVPTNAPPQQETLAIRALADSNRQMAHVTAQLAEIARAQKMAAAEQLAHPSAQAAASAKSKDTTPDNMQWARLQGWCGVDRPWLIPAFWMEFLQLTNTESRRKLLMDLMVAWSVTNNKEIDTDSVRFNDVKIKDIASITPNPLGPRPEWVPPQVIRHHHAGNSSRRRPLPGSQNTHDGGLSQWQVGRHHASTSRLCGDVAVA
jgi:hypothetical protein